MASSASFSPKCLKNSGPVSDALQKHTQIPRKDSDLHDMEENRVGSTASLARDKTEPV